MSLILHKGSHEDKGTPPHWIHIHESAMTTSMAAGAFSYAITKLAGDATTTAAKQGISILGLVLAFGAKQMGDDVLSNQVMGATSAATTVVQTWGQKVTAVGSAMACATTAAVVGSGCMIGKMAYQMWQQMRAEDAEHGATCPQEVHESDGTDFVIYEITSTGSKIPVPREVKTSTPADSPLTSPNSEEQIGIDSSLAEIPECVATAKQSPEEGAKDAPDAPCKPQHPQQAKLFST